MTLPKPQAIWREQCEAAHRIKERYGLNAALDYLVAEKLIQALSGGPGCSREESPLNWLASLIADAKQRGAVSDHADKGATRGDDPPG